jgi:hypothetical protein
MKPNKPKTDEQNVIKENNKDEKIESLDDLIQVIEGDELRHVIGGGRSKTPPFRMT